MYMRMCDVYRCMDHRDDAASALSLQPHDLELSMGMSGDFEMAVRGICLQHTSFV